MDGTIVGVFWEAWKAALIIALAMAPIPDHKPSGVLPPFLGASPGEHSALMSPYLSTTEEFVAKFATSKDRRRILTGYLDHRAALRRLGIKDGFQWLDGSFADRMPREPRDIDTVTFFIAPAAWSAPDAALAVRNSNGSVFDHNMAKRTYLCDAFFVRLDDDDSASLIEIASYWLGLFSHQRDTFAWRGIVSVSLNSDDDDASARDMIQRMESIDAEDA